MTQMLKRSQLSLRRMAKLQRRVKRDLTLLLRRNPPRTAKMTRIKRSESLVVKQFWVSWILDRVYF